MDYFGFARISYMGRVALRIKDFSLDDVVSAAESGLGCAVKLLGNGLVARVHQYFLLAGCFRRRHFQRPAQAIGRRKEARFGVWCNASGGVRQYLDRIGPKFSV
jgi:hypothetical protein